MWYRVSEASEVFESLRPLQILNLSLNFKLHLQYSINTVLLKIVVCYKEFEVCEIFKSFRVLYTKLNKI